VQALFAIFGEYVVFCHSFCRETVFFREGNPEILVLKIVERRREASHIFDEAAKIVGRARFVGDRDEDATRGSLWSKDAVPPPKIRRSS
jgi:hypothetical protein